jgi:hypothetical protein
MYKCIVLAYDGSEPGQQALLECKDLAQWSHAKLWRGSTSSALIERAPCSVLCAITR